VATLALNSGLWVRRLLNSFGEGFANGGSPFQGRYPASEINDGTCPEKPDHLKPNCSAITGLIGCFLSYYYGQLQSVRELKDVLG